MNIIYYIIVLFIMIFIVVFVIIFCVKYFFIRTGEFRFKDGEYRKYLRGTSYSPSQSPEESSRRSHKTSYKLLLDGIVQPFKDEKMSLGFDVKSNSLSESSKEIEKNRKKQSKVSEKIDSSRSETKSYSE